MEGGESLNEWEQVQLEIVAVKNNHHLQHDLSIFPPSYHESLQIPPPQIPPPPSPPPQIPPPPLPPPPDSQTSTQSISASVCNNSESEAGLPPPPPDSEPKMGNEIGKRLRLRFEILRTGIVWIVSRAGGGSGFWSFATSVSVVTATAVLLYWKVQRWRQWVREESENRLILLIKEKDQKISQLLLQIAQMNEMLSARRKVPIIRVG